MEITFCSIIILLIIILILTGNLKRENYGPPPGMLESLPVQEYYCHKPMIASPSKETLKNICGPSMICKEKPDCYRGFENGPLEYQANSASSISHMIERTA